MISVLGQRKVSPMTSSLGTDLHDRVPAAHQSGISVEADTISLLPVVYCFSYFLYRSTSNSVSLWCITKY